MLPQTFFEETIGEITAPVCNSNLLSSDKISSSEIKRLRNEYLEISPYLPTYYTPDGQKGGSFQKGIEIFILS